MVIEIPSGDEDEIDPAQLYHKAQPLKVSFSFLSVSLHPPDSARLTLLPL